jgi:spore cortex biosynthesis protein YabQ
MEFVHWQLNTFLVLLFTGMLWGAFFDLYRVFRSQIRVNRAIDVIGDILFWIFAAILIIPFIYWATWFELRLFVWLIIILGLILYFTFLSRILIPVFKGFWRAVNWFPGKIISMIGRFKTNLERLLHFFDRKKL